MRKLVLSILGFIIVSLSFSVHAQTYTLHPGIDLSMKFPPGQENVVANPLFWSLTIKCKMHASNAQTLMQAKAIKKGGTLGGQTIKQGQTKQMMINNGQSLSIKVDGSAKIGLTNLSDQLISAKCST